ncbi:hypothetical protein J2T58_000137 [Methanocalculus alkaliphilus]|nr:hypothetical protein [Methanocalculus alkaliphilus]
MSASCTPAYQLGALRTLEFSRAALSERSVA